MEETTEISLPVTEVVTEVTWREMCRRHIFKLCFVGSRTKSHPASVDTAVSTGFTPLPTLQELQVKQQVLEEKHEAEGVIFSCESYSMRGYFWDNSDLDEIPECHVANLRSLVTAIGLHGCSDTAALYLLWSFLAAPRRWEDNGFARHSLKEEQGSHLAEYGCELCLHLAEPMRFRLIMLMLREGRKSARWPFPLREAQGLQRDEAIEKHIDETRAVMLSPDASTGFGWVQKVGINTWTFDLADFADMDALSVDSAIETFGLFKEYSDCDALRDRPVAAV